MNGEIENFDGVVSKGEEIYKSFTSIRCPYLESEVNFSTQGLEHIKFKKHGKARFRHDQYMRFKLLHLVPEVLKLSKTVHGLSETKHFERVRMHSRTDTILKAVTYYEFIAILKKVRIKVIVKQIEDGEYLFWSVIPFWGIHRETRKRKLYSGNPEAD